MELAATSVYAKVSHGGSHQARPDNAQGGIETHALLTVRGGVHCAFSTREKSLTIFTAYRIHRKLSVEICLGVGSGADTVFMMFLLHAGHYCGCGAYTGSLESTAGGAGYHCNDRTVVEDRT